MKITYYNPDEDTKLLLITAPEIDDLIENTSDYESVKLTANVNCNDDLEQEYDIDDIADVDNKFYISSSAGGILVTASMFSISEVADGIYFIQVKLAKDQEFIIIQNCAFMDVDYKCKVAAYGKTILTGDSTSTNVHILHYALTNGSNCGCNCDGLCLIFNELKKILDNSDLVVNNDCEC